MHIRFLVPVMAMLLASAGMAHAADSIGVVGALTGKATATAAGKARALSVGDAITREDMLSTGAGSKMQLMLNDQSTITLNPNSKLKVSEFAFDETAHDGSIKMNALKGAFRFIGGAVSKNREAKIKTPVSSIGIRGSIGDMFIAANGATDAVFASGDQMSMTNANGDTTVTTDFGTGFSMQTANDAPQPMSLGQVLSRSTNFTSAAPETGGSNSGDSGDDGSAGGGDAAGANGNDGGDGDAGGDDSASAGDDSAEGFGDFANDDGDDGDAGSDNAGAENAAGGDNGSADNSAGATTSDAATENQRVDTVNNLSGDDANAFNDPDSVRNTIRTAIDNGADASGNNNGNAAGTTGGGDTIDSSIAFRGLMTELDYDFTAASEDVDAQEISELKNIVRNLTANTFQGDAEVVDANATNAANIGTTSSIDVPRGPSGGGAFHNLTPGPDFLEVNGDAYDATVFRSPSGLTSYYRLNQIGSNVTGNNFTTLTGADIGDEIKLLIGQEVTNAEIATVQAATLAQSNNNGTDNITYYGFLPDLNNHSLADAPTAGHDGIGIFNYGYIDIEPGNANETDFANLSPTTGQFGVAINWDTEQFFSGFVRWGEGDATANDDFDTVAFGQVDTTGGSSNLFDGNAYTIGSDPEAAEEHVLDSNYSTGFKDTNNVVEAIVLGGQDASDASIDGAILQPGYLLDTSGANGTELKANTNAQTAGLTTYHGFTAGFHERDKDAANASNALTTISNSDASNFSVTTDTTNDTTHAEIEVDAAGDAKLYKYSFGANSNATSGDSVFLSDDLYAAELGRAERVETGGPTTEYDVDDDGYNTGFIANATVINDTPAGNECAACDYVHWGVWSASTDLGASGNGVTNEIDVTQLVPYVAGEAMTGAEFNTYAGATGGAHSYSGEMIGTVHNAGNFTQETGAFTVDIDLLNRELESFNGTLGGFTLVGAGPAPINTSAGIAQTTTALALTISGTANGAGSLNGAVFGPAAENVGGNFVGTAGGGSHDLTGVFLGSRP